MSIVVFDPLANDYTGNGVASLVPTGGSVRTVAGGEYSFTMQHPLDPWGKWKHLVREAIVRLPVPAERIENSYTGMEADIYKTNTNAALREGPSEPSTITYPTWDITADYSVGDKVTWLNKNYKCNYYDETSPYAHIAPPSCSWWEQIARGTSGAAVLIDTKSGTELYFVEDAGSGWYKMSTYYGLVGYMKSSQLTFDRHTTPSENQPREITEQLFRIKNVDINRKEGRVSISGVHVSYDLNGNIVDDLTLGQVTPAMAIGRLSESFMMPYPGMIATNLTSNENGTFTQTFTRKNAMYCLTDPDSGIVPTFQARLTRDNWDLFVMDNTPVDRGLRIRYGKNADGIQWRIKTDGLITRVMPVAKAEDGQDFYLPEKWVDSDHISDYPVIYMEALNVKGQVGKDDGSGTDTTWTEEALLDEMRAKAEERFTVQKADIPVTEVTVEFEPLERTEEFAYLRGLQRVNLYDLVKAQDPEIGLDIQLKVTEIEYDFVNRKIAGLKLSSIEDTNSRTVAGYNVVNGTIGAEKLKGDLIHDIQDGAASEAVQIVQERRVEVIDNLTSTATGAALSANQGRVLNEKWSPSAFAAVSITSSRGTLNSGGYIQIGKIVIIAFTFTASANATNSPQITGTPPSAKVDSALSCIDITNGIGSAIEEAIPCGISTMGRVYQKKITSGHIYAITGVYIAN